ncbi:MAG TPA: Tox-REase-5 domain-containing protein, partial [Stellaceae bacterium]|nr:Tox-REase-5 domain-containing protein [Stellaceae bacterium]
GAQAQTDTDRDEPKLCPDPGPDRPGSGRSADAVAYQAYVSTLVNPDLPTPPGMAVALYSSSRGNDVYFDDCRHTDGVMIEAKGPGYEDLIESGRKNEKFKKLIDKKLVGQANDQLDAAQGRPIEWYFGEKGAADYVRELFRGDTRLCKIKIIYMPMPR